MFSAIAVALVSVALGAALGLVPGPRGSSRGPGAAIGPVRTFALVAAVAAVLLGLLPESFVSLGTPALVVFFTALFLPVLAEQGIAFVVRKRGASPDAGEKVRSFGVELGYAGLVLHHIGDGMALGASLTRPWEMHPEVAVAIGAHTVPVIAVVVLTFGALNGRRAAIMRATGLAAATILGILAATSIPPAISAGLDAWVAAAVSGLLLHVLGHDLGADPPRTRAARLLDLGAAIAGAATILLAGHAHHEGEADPATSALGASFVDLSIETAPLLLLGLLAAACVQAFDARIPASWFRPGAADTAASRVAFASRGVIAGAPLPVCACGVVPVAETLRSRGAHAAFVVAFLLATPELGVETFALGWQLLGPHLAIAKLAGALSVALIVAVFVAGTRAAPRHDHGHPHSHDHHHDDSAPLSFPAQGAFTARLVHAFSDLLGHTGPWILIGLAAAAFADALLPSGALTSAHRGELNLFFVVLLALPSYFCAPAAVPIAAVLLGKGLSPALVFAGVSFASIASPVVLSFLKDAYGGRAALVALTSGLLVVAAFSWGIDSWMPPPPLRDARLETHDHGPFAWIGAGLLGVLVLQGLYRDGLRAWFGVLFSTEGRAEHQHHHHAHADGHAEHAHEVVE